MAYIDGEPLWIASGFSNATDNSFGHEIECQAVIGNLLAHGANRQLRVTKPLNVPPKENLGPYRLIGSLGTGGMGAVYLAEHQRLKRQVAIKLLPREKLERSGWLDRFNREMTSIAALEHPNVVRAIDAGDQDGWHYLVMEYLDGLDASKVCRRVADISVGAACNVARQAALGLSAIHAHGMIHRDIKPSNVFLTRTGQVKLLDLGLVFDGQSPLTADERLTTVGHLMGTVAYMAREQLLDARNVDWRADIYSLGATLFRMLTGHPPFGSGENLAQTIHAINTTECPRIVSLRQDLPLEVAELIDSMLSHEVALRPQSALKVADALSPFCDTARRLLRTRNERNRK